MLRDPASRRPERQRTLAAAIGWSYDLLFPDDQRGLWALATFVGGAPLDGVERVLGALGVPAEAALDVVDRLVDRSLVTIEATADGDLRYWLLDSVRSFALDRLDESGEAPTAFGAHAGWVAAASDAAAVGARGPDQPHHVRWASTERANVDAALAWAGSADPVLALTIATQLGWVWMLVGDHAAAERMRVALTAAEPVATGDLRLSGCLLLGWLYAAGGDVELGRAIVVDAIEQFDFAGDDLARARADFFLAYVLSQKGDFEECQRVLERSRPVFAELGEAWDEAANRVLYAHVALAGGDQAKATQACTEATRLLTEVRDPWFLVHTGAMLGAIAQAEARYEDACDHLDRAAAAALSQGFASTEAYHRANLGRAQQQRGDLDAAALSLQAAIDVARAAGDLRVAALARMRLGRVLREQGDPEAARSQLLAAQAWYRASGGGDHALLTDCLVAVTAPPEGRERSLLDEVLDEARRSADFEVEVLVLDALARQSADAGDLHAAATWLELADAAMPAARLRVTEADRIDAHVVRPLLSSSRGSSSRHVIEPRAGPGAGRRQVASSRASASSQRLASASLHGCRVGTVPTQSGQKGSAMRTTTPDKDARQETDANTIRAIVQDGFGTADTWRLADIAKPSIEPDEVLVRVRAAGLDRGTWHLMTGRPYLIRVLGFGVRGPKNRVPGLAIAGTVVDVGSKVTRFSIGDDVYGVGRGAFAEFSAAPEDKLSRKPRSLTFEQAAAVPVSATSAWQAVQLGRIEAGQSVMVLGASGGIGTYAVQIAKALGAEVTGVCSTAKIDLVRSIGADHVVDYTKHGVTDGVRRYDVILDLGGNTSLRQLRKTLNPGAALVIVGGESKGDWTGGFGRSLRAPVWSLFLPERLTALNSDERYPSLERDHGAHR